MEKTKTEILDKSVNLFEKIMRVPPTLKEYIYPKYWKDKRKIFTHRSSEGIHTEFWDK